MRSGLPSPLQKDVPFYQALDDPETRLVYIRRKCEPRLGSVC